MAGPQFFTPQPTSKTRPRRRFTVAQANATLPLVKRIVADIVRCHDQVTRCQDALDQSKNAKDQKRLQAELQSGLGHMQDYVEELQDVGCDLKDYRTGLVDFVGRHQGHDVCLCWKLGEGKIDYWHETDAGFAGRQPIVTLDEK